MEEIALRQNKPQSASKNNQIKRKSNSQIQMMIETRRNNMEAEKMEEALSKQDSSNSQSHIKNKGLSETDSPGIVNKNNTSHGSKIPVPIKETSKKSEKLAESTIDKERLRGAIRKQPKNVRQKKPNVPTKINHKSFTSPQMSDHRNEKERLSANINNISPGDIVDDVLYITSPLKIQNSVGVSSDTNQKPSPQTGNIHNPDFHLQAFELIAPDNFTIYKALSVNHEIDTAKPLVKDHLNSNIVDAKTRVLNQDTSKDNLSETQSGQNRVSNKNSNNSSSSLTQHSLEEVDSSNIRNGSRPFLPSDTRSIHEGQSSRNHNRPFNSGMVTTILNQRGNNDFI